MKMKASEGLLRFPQTDQRLHLPDPLLILFCSDLVPRHAPPAVRIKSSLHGDLCPVIDTGTSRQGKENGELLIELVQIMEPVHEPLRVMGIQKVEQHVVVLLHIHSITAIHHVFKLFFAHRPVEEKVMDPAHQRIIHDRIVLVPCEPLTGVMPDFSQEIDVRLDLLQMFSHPFQKAVRHLIPHVKAYAVDIILPDPALAHPAEILDHFRVIRVELRHPVCKGKRVEPAVPGVSLLSDLFPVLHHEPVRILRSSPLFLHIKPGAEFPAAVIEHCVQHDADPSFMCLRDKRLHRLIIPEGRIDLRIVHRVVFVVRLRLHDGIQIDSRDPQILKIRKLLPDSLQIAAIFLLVRHLPGLPGQHIGIIFLPIPPAEPVREDLIPYCIIDPAGRPVHIRRVHPRDDKILQEPSFHIDLFLCQKSILKIIPHLVLCMKLKIILAPLISRGECGRPPELMGKTLLIEDLFPLSGPLLTASQDPRVKGIPMMDEYLLHVISGLQIDDQPVLIQRIAHLF